jgi:outer membrane receptor protein involved in Fe transport
MRCFSLAVAAALLLIVTGAVAQPATEGETVFVRAGALPGAALDPSALPMKTEVLTPQDIARFGPPAVLQSLESQAAGVSLSQAQNNPFQPNITYRGFEASPLAGNAQGLAVYVNGVRFNQPFGDVVNWDLIPDIAIDQLAVESANPVLGLNALGGAIGIRFKTGFTHQGTNVLASGGSFGRFQGAFETGIQGENQAFYVAGSALTDSGWRDHSPSRLSQLLANFVRRGSKGEIQLDLLGADSDLTGNGPAPVELLDAARAAVFTYPDQTRNTFGLANLSGTIVVSDKVSLQGNVYVTGFRQRTKNGDASEAEPCEDDEDLLCFEDGDAVTALGDVPIEAFPVDLVYGQLNTTATNTTGVGASFQVSSTASLFQRSNHVVAGAAIDFGRTDFSAESLLGSLAQDRGFTGPGILIAQDDGSITPVAVTGENTYFGFYAADVLKLTERLSLSIAARYNIANITLSDELGTALDGDHTYSRFNPAVGLTWQATPNLAIYAGYAEANRAPTPAEFSCADATAPCSLTNFFVSDPELKQVVARTVEAGFRGTRQWNGSTLAWQMGVYRSNVDDDIQFVASEILGRGFFQNVDKTQRQGLDASFDFTNERWSIDLNYSYTEAVFRSPLVLNSPENPNAGDDGLIEIVSGNRFPSIPANVVKAVVSRNFGTGFTLTLGMRAASGVYLRGDESNLDPKTDAYAVFSATGTYRVTEAIEIFATIENLFDTKYETFGTFSPTGSVPLAEAPGATNPRSLSPAPPISIFAGLRARL